MANVDEKGILFDTYSSIWDTFGFEPEISISQKSSNDDSRNGCAEIPCRVRSFANSSTKP